MLLATFTRRRAIPIVALLTAVVAIVAILQPLSFLHSTAVDMATRQLERLEDAVSSGVLDQEILDELRREGEAVAIVSLETGELIERLRSQLAAGEDVAQVIAHMRPIFAELKRSVRVHIGDDVVVKADFDNLSSTILRFRSEEALLNAVRLPLVAGVRAIRFGEAQMTESLALIRQPEVNRAGFRGQNTYIAVLDTGVDYLSYPSYFPSGSVARSWDAAPEDGKADDYGHGTHVASTILGMAPGTKIIAIDVFSWRPDASGKLAIQWDSASLLKAINQTIELKRQGFDIRAMNLSLGSGNTYHNAYCTDDLGFGAAYAAGIIPVVSSGNDATRSGSFRSGVSYPACSEYALSVGATTDGAQPGVANRCEASTAADRLTSFTQSGSTLRMLAPGNCIVAATGSNQGTSMAAPHVAGAVAVLASAKPAATASQIWTALTGSGQPISDSRIAGGLTRNRLDVAAAVRALGVSVTTSTPSDRTVPSVQAPVQAITAGAQLRTDGLVHTTVTWSATDASGIARYAVRMSVNGGAWTDVTLASAGATSTAFWLTPGSKYQFAVAAQDRAGNWSGWVHGQTLTVGRYADNHAAVTYSGTWERVAWGSALDGALAVSGQAGAYGCFRFNGSHVAWLASMDTNRGTATVWLDGAKVATLDLYSATVRARTVAFSRSVSPSKTHDLCVQVVGTAGRPSIDIDGFALLY